MEALSRHWGTEITGHFSRALGSVAPRALHFAVSKFFSKLFETPFSKSFILPYAWYQYKDRSYLSRFAPASGMVKYQSFQDFFTRALQKPVTDVLPFVWPCEGTLCESSAVNPGMKTLVKGDKRYIEVIFDEPQGSIPNSYYFTNVFLHNKNYHRIHCPVSGTVESIRRLPGKLFFLRPRLNGNMPSFPAIYNERVNVRLKDNQNRNWYISIVGGPGVATVQLAKGLVAGTTIRAGQEMAIFKLGSTCCMAAPLPPSVRVGTSIEVGSKYDL